MDITIDKKNNTEAEVAIKIEEKDYQHDVDKKLKEYSRTAQIKGFRPGKVPISLIKKMYGKSILVEEVYRKAHQELGKFLEDQKISVLGEPLPVDEKHQSVNWEKPGDIELSYEVGFYDNLSFSPEKVSVTQYEIKLDKKSLEETISNIRKQNGRQESTDKLGKDDIVVVKIGSGEEAKEKNVLAEHMSKDGFKKFAAAKKGDKLSIDLKKAIESENLVLSILDATDQKMEDVDTKVEVEVADFLHPIEADLNQELFDKIFGPDQVKDEKEFREKLEALLLDSYTNETSQYNQQQVKEKAIETLNIDLPEPFLKKWLLRSNQELTEEQLESDFDFFIKDLKWMILKDQIAKDQNIKVEREEVIQYAVDMIRNQFKSYGMADMPEEQLKGFAQNYLSNKEEDNFRKTYDMLYERKILESLESQVKENVKKVSVEEFQKILQN